MSASAKLARANLRCRVCVNQDLLILVLKTILVWITPFDDGGGFIIGIRRPNIAWIVNDRPCWIVLASKRTRLRPSASDEGGRYASAVLIDVGKGPGYAKITSSVCIGHRLGNRSGKLDHATRACAGPSVLRCLTYRHVVNIDRLSLKNTVNECGGVEITGASVIYELLVRLI
jgi:hypothetical protein